MNWEAQLQQQVKEIHEVSRFLIQAFSDYGAKLLGVQHLPLLAEKNVTKQMAHIEVMRFHLSWESFINRHGIHDFYSSHELLDYLGEAFTELGSFFIT